MKPWIIKWAMNQNKGVAPTGEISITENGTYDVTTYASANVNVAQSNNAKINPVLDGTQSGSTIVYKSIEELPQLDATGVTDLGLACRNYKKLKKINGGLNNTGNLLYINNMFEGATSLTDAPIISDTSKIETIAGLFDGCTSLVNVPSYNLPRVGASSSAFSATFRNCSSLSSDSLNNILAMCISMVRISSGKYLSSLGLSETQIEVCKTLSNYQAFLEAGWYAS